MVAPSKPNPTSPPSRFFFGIGIRLAGVGTVVLAMYFFLVTESPIQGLRDTLSWMIPVGLLFWIVAVALFTAGLAVRGSPPPVVNQPGAMGIDSGAEAGSGSTDGWITAARLGIEKRFPSVFHQEWTLPLLRSFDGATFIRLGAAYFREIGFHTVVIQEISPGIDIWLFDEEAPDPTGAVECLPWGDALVGVRPVKTFHELLIAEGVGHGVIITTGVFSKEALAYAAGKTLELISGEDFLEKLTALPEETSQRLLAEMTRTEALAKTV